MHGARVVELAARLGGGHDAELCEAALGVDLNELALAAALGESIPPQVLTPLDPVGGAVTRFLVAPPGELQAVDGRRGGAGHGGRLRRPHLPAAGLALRRAARRARTARARCSPSGRAREEALGRASAAAERIRFVTADVDAKALA